VAVASAGPCPKHFRVSTAPGNPGNPGNLLEFKNPPGNPGDLLEFNGPSWKFLCQMIDRIGFCS